ncbi:MAG: hypothetical protein PHE06_09870 [Lachnospiraceae bacterium]|nr:hypothetical protein [Lachnospiraceae bacterium]
MGRQIRLLSRIGLCNLFGINEIRYTKDRKKKIQYAGLAAVWLLLLLVYLFYLITLSNGLIAIGLGSIVPMYFYTLTSLVILCFSFFKASSVIFQSHSFEMLISLPVTEAAVIISRFWTMYLTNLLLSLITLIPGMILYGSRMHSGPLFYLIFLAGTLLLPLLPMTISTAAGAVITAIGARMKHKSLVISLLTILLVVAVMAVSIMSQEKLGSTATVTEEMMTNMAVFMQGQIGRLYLPAVWFNEAAVYGSWKSFLLLAFSAILLFGLFVGVLQKYYGRICQALQSSSAKNNYKMQSLSTASVLKSLWGRELRRYFASSVYVSNTIIGYILMAAAAIGIFAAGTQRVAQFIQIPGITEKAIPLLISFMAAIMPTTSCSVSMEGKEFWIVKSLPLRSKAIFDSKILVNLTVACPFYLIAVIFGCLSMRNDPMMWIWILLVPAAYLWFMAVLGITVNLAVPVLNWESEVRVVKQSASTMITMLIGFLSFIPSAACIWLLPQISIHLIFAITVIVLMGASIVLYWKNNRKKLINLE